MSAAYKGEPVIARVCRAARATTGGVYLSGRSNARAEALMRLVGVTVVRPILDSDTRCTGPMRGMVTAGRELRCPRLLFLPGDLPRLDSSLLARFLAHAGPEAASSIVWGSGMVESLIQTHAGGTARALTEQIAEVRGRSARPTDMLRGARELLLVHAKNITRDCFALSNLNQRSDLDLLSPRGDFNGAVSGDVNLSGHASALFWEAANAFAEGDFTSASELFEAEANVYAGVGVRHLGAHCLADASSAARKHGDGRRAALLTKAAETDLAEMKTVHRVRCW